MLAHHASLGDAFGRPDGSFPPKYLSLEQVQLRPRRPSSSSVASTRKSSRPQKLRIVTSPVAPAYRPSNTTNRPKKTKSIRPKQEQPPSPAMSGYSYSSSDQGNYSYQASYPASGVPQYTQSQINTYYAQYQCYPPQPYQIIPDYYVQPVHVAPTAGYQQPVIGGYGTGGWPSHGDDLGMNTSQGPTRSNSRTKTWTCDISSCTSSANFTRLADLQRHQSTVHGVGTPGYPCDVPRCNRIGDKGFTRRDHLVEHLRNFHHIDIPKRRPGERSAFPFGWPEGGGGAGGSHQDEEGTGIVGGGQEMTGHARRSSQRVRMLGDSGSGIVQASPQRSATTITSTSSTRDRTTGLTRGRIAKPPSRRGGRAGGRSRGGSSSAGMSRLSVSSSAWSSSSTSTSTSTLLSRGNVYQEQGSHSSSSIQLNPPPPQRHPLDLTNAELAAQDMLLGGVTGSGDFFGLRAPDPETYPER